jgi:hypothetical protein
MNGMLFICKSCLLSKTITGRQTLLSLATKIVLLLKVPRSRRPSSSGQLPALLIDCGLRIVFHAGDETSNQCCTIDGRVEKLLQGLVDMGQRIFVALWSLIHAQHSMRPVASSDRAHLVSGLPFSSSASTSD